MAAGVLRLCQELLSFESSSRFGTEGFDSVLRKSFPNFKWKKTKPISGHALHYFESLEGAEEVDLVYYCNVETNNPSSLSLWTYTDMDPLKVTLNKGIVYGLGALHEKISAVPALKVLSDLCLKGELKTKNIVFIAGYGREMNMIGAKRAIKEVLSNKKVKKLCVAHPTDSKLAFNSVGRTKMEIYIPFSDSERNCREKHDLQENISSQSKVFSYRGGDKLSDNVIFKALESCSLLPSSSLMLDFSGGANTISEPESVYLELDFIPNVSNSMVSKLEGFANLFEDFNKKLVDKFESMNLDRAMHLGRCVTNSEGLSLYGFNLIPSRVDLAELQKWYQDFKAAVEKVGGEIRLRDSKRPFFSKMRAVDFDTYQVSEAGCDNVTEASLFSRYYDNVFILGVGKEGLSKKPNENISLVELERACSVYEKLYRSL